MRAVGIRKFKNKLFPLCVLVEAGKLMLVTDRGSAVPEFCFLRLTIQSSEIDSAEARTRGVGPATLCRSWRVPRPEFYRPGDRSGDYSG